MITVSILINGQPLFTRSARNQDDDKNENGETKYITDAGDVIWCKRSDGAVELAKAMLGTIKTEKL